jgi:hypothetical protein
MCAAIPAFEHLEQCREIRARHRRRPDRAGSMAPARIRADRYRDGESASRVTSKARKGPMGVASSQPAAPCTTQARSMSMPAKRAGHQLRGGRVIGADESKARRRGIGQRPEQIEYRAHAERGANRRHGLHRRMIVRREQEREAGGLEALRRAGLVQRQRNPSCSIKSALPLRLEIERLPCLTTGSPQAAASSAAPVDKIEAAGRIAAGADDVDGIQAVGSAGLRASARMAPAKPRTSAA